MPALNDPALKQLFLEARTYYRWKSTPVEDQLLLQLYNLARMPPTGYNSQPLRLLFVKSLSAKEKLKPALAPANVSKVMTAPVTAIVAYDLEFYRHMGKLAPHIPNLENDLASAPEESIRRMAQQNATLQGAYLIFAARSLGLDCGPLGGFDAAKVDAAFLVEKKWKSIFLLNLGYGDPSNLHSRAARLDFETACEIQ